MLRYLAASALAALLLLGSGQVQAQPLRPINPNLADLRLPDPLAGSYINRTLGGIGYVYRRPAGYLFVNENGVRAAFAFTGPGQLRMVDGDWNPYTAISANEDSYGRVILTFEEPGVAPVVWVKR